MCAELADAPALSIGSYDGSEEYPRHGISHGQLFGVTLDDLDVERVQVCDLTFR